MYTLSEMSSMDLETCLETIYAFINCVGFQKFPEAILSQL